MSEFKSQLVNGAIPIFSVCNYLDECSDKTAFCPNGFNAREYPCAIAVSYELIRDFDFEEYTYDSKVL